MEARLKWIVLCVMIGVIFVSPFISIGVVDNDSLSAYQEHQIESSIVKTDTDSDGLPDGIEHFSITEISESDSDSDGLNDSTEYNSPCLNATQFDTDSDKLNDSQEYYSNSNPCNPDTDTDNLSDYLETVRFSSNVTKQDTDYDNLSDYAEIKKYHSNVTKQDTDSDGLPDYQEVTHNTDIRIEDTDNDQISDYQEVKQYNTNPLLPDTDNDSIPDETEIFTLNSNPLKKNSDGDMYSDYTEYKYGFNTTIPTKTKQDSDYDGLSNSQEKQVGSNKYNSDTDNDGISDSAEVFRTNLYPNAEITQKDIYIEYDVKKGTELDEKEVKKVKQLYNTSPKGTIDIHFIKSQTGLTITSNFGFSNLESISQKQFNHSEDVYYYMVITNEINAKKWEMNETGISKTRIFAIEGATYQSYLIAHELAHAIGLFNQDFEGIDSSKYKYKNYNSVMNYNWNGQPITYSQNRPFNDWKLIWNNISPYNS